MECNIHPDLWSLYQPTFGLTWLIPLNIYATSPNPGTTQIEKHKLYQRYSAGIDPALPWQIR